MCQHICGGLNEDGSCRLICLKGWFPVGVQEGLGGVVLLGVCLWRWALSFPHARPSLSFFLSPHLLSVAYRSGCKLLATAPVPFSHHDYHGLILSNCKEAPN